MNLGQSNIIDKTRNKELSIEEGADQWQELKNIEDKPKVDQELDNRVQAQRKELQAISRGKGEQWLDENLAHKYDQKLQKPGDPKTIMEVLTELENRRQRFKEWQQKLELGNNVRLDDGTYRDTIFTLSDKLDSRVHYTKKFIALDDAEQARWLNLILQNIDERKKQFNKLVGLVSNDSKNTELEVFQAQTRKERNEYLQTYNQLDRVLSRWSVDQKEKDEKRRLFGIAGLNEKREILRTLDQEVKQPELNEHFKKANPDIQSKYPDFYQLRISEKKRALQEIRNIYREKYQALYKGKSHFTSKDINDFDQFAYNNEWNSSKGGWNFEDMTFCLNNFEAAEQTAIECHKKGQEYSDQVRDHFDWERIGSWDRKQLLDNGKLETMQNAEHLALSQKYKKLLQSYLPKGKEGGKYGLITKDALKKYQEWFDSQDIDTKKLIANEAKQDDLQASVKKRKEVNKDFESLPLKFIKQNEEEFKKSGSEERKTLVEKLKIEAKESAELEKKFQDKVEKMLKGKLLATDSTQEYLNWFQELNLKDQKKFLKASDLDNKDRKTELAKFEKLEQYLPKNRKVELSKKFYNSDLETRTKLNKEWQKEFAPAEDFSDLNQPIETLSAPVLSLALLIKNAKKFTLQGKNQTAIDLYEAWLEEAEVNPALATKEEIQEVQDEIAKLKETDLNLNEEEQTNPVLQNFIDSECETLIAQNQALREKIKQLTVVEELGDIMHRNELRYGQKPSTQEQMQSTVTGNKYVELNQAIQEESNNEEGLVKQNGQLKLEKTKIFDIRDFQNNETSRLNWTEYAAEQIQAKAQPERIDLTLGAQLDGKEISAEEYQRRVSKPLKQSIDQELSGIIIAKISQMGYSAEAINDPVTKALQERKHKVAIKPTRRKKAA